MNSSGRVVTELLAPEEAAARGLREAALRHFLVSHYGPEQIGALVEWPSDDLWSAVRAQAGEVMAAHVGTELAGFCRVVLGERPHVLALFVHPQRARSGIGGALLQAALAQCRAAGAKELYVGASLNAVPFYHRHGFIPGPNYLWWLPTAYGADLVPVQLRKMVKKLQAGDMAMSNADTGEACMLPGSDPPAEPCLHRCPPPALPS